jgi:tol-pal system protein YbgF
MEADPFGRGGEPPIRMGARGGEAPPVTAARAEPKPPTPKTPDFSVMDDQGNLVDADGKVVYRAGTGSPGIDTEEEGEPEPDRRFEDDPHAAPSELVDRAVGVPLIGKPAGDQKPASGIHPVVEQRLKELTLAEGGLPDPLDREIPIRVQGAEPAEEPMLAPPLLAAPPAPDPGREPAAAPDPAVALLPALRPPRPAPGPRHAIAQVAFPAAKDRSARQQYEVAVAKLNARAYSEAESRFESFLERHFAHELADNALYWLGETAYAQGEWLQALAWFQDVMIRYPSGNKLADAMLKTALCYAALGDTSYAARILSDVESLYPTSPIARTARERREALEAQL